MRRLKIYTILSVFVLVGFVINNTSQVETYASGDKFVEQIRNYKSWAKITEQPFAVSHKSSADEKPDMFWFDSGEFG